MTDYELMGAVHKGAGICAGVAILLGVVVALLASIVVVPPASVGIVVTLGFVSSATLDPGIHAVWPVVTTVHTLSTKTTLLEQSNHVPTKEGLTVELDSAVLYHIEREQAIKLFVEVGADYQKVLIEPELASAVRGLTSEAEASALCAWPASRLELRQGHRWPLTLNSCAMVRRYLGQVRDADEAAGGSDQRATLTWDCD